MDSKQRTPAGLISEITRNTLQIPDVGPVLRVRMPGLPLQNPDGLAQLPLRLPFLLDNDCHRWMTAENLRAILRKNLIPEQIPILFGGGEPLRQAEFLREVLQEAPDGTFPGKVFLETELQAEREPLMMLLGLADLWVVNLHTLDPDHYRHLTGKSLVQPLANLPLLLTEPVCLVLRRDPAGRDLEREVQMLTHMGFSADQIAIR